jgi:hypothetical protein
MTTVTLRDEAELSLDELDQVAGGRASAGGGGVDVIPLLIIAATAATVVVAMVAGLWRDIFGSK